MTDEALSCRAMLEDILTMGEELFYMIFLDLTATGDVYEYL